MVITAQQIFFILFAGLAIAGALGVIVNRSPLHGALSLIATFAGLSCLYVMLSAQFIAVIQIIVYAGAILVLFVFVIMLLNVRSEESRIDRNRSLRWVAIPFAIVLAAVGIATVKRVTMQAPRNAGQTAAIGTTRSIGEGLFTTYLLPFEATSVLIMMAIVGSMVLARRGRAEDMAPADANVVEPAGLVDNPVTGAPNVQSLSPADANEPDHGPVDEAGDSVEEVKKN
jgi:NADH-quinone oxidoreductase subunit J